ncbi:MAG: bifunctional riboflavin kinase/FAD synthetase [Bernardetiaceae bacterium]|nr:bifunctional riboflavin kinase/FAD synthetase [Bernardetiaceae bacterium]
MRIYRELNQFPKPSYTILTSGTFDGVHQGHQKILARLRSLKQQIPTAETVLLTYHPHPRLVLTSNYEGIELLSTLEERSELLAEQGIDHLCIIPFSKEFAKTSSQTFIQKILIQTLAVRKLVIGYDHRFGKNREGGFEHLKAYEKQYGFEVEEIPRQDIDNLAISSTKIRNALLGANLAQANELLGYPYRLSGRVVKGNQIGRTIGYPTANVEVDDLHKLVPANGIYAVRVLINQKFYKGMLSIGVRPTIGEELARTIEVNIFDFDYDIYGHKIRIDFIAYLRPEAKYDSLAQLQQQLKIDKNESLKALAAWA